MQLVRQQHGSCEHQIHGHRGLRSMRAALSTHTQHMDSPLTTFVFLGPGACRTASGQAGATVGGRARCEFWTARAVRGQIALGSVFAPSYGTGSFRGNELDDLH